MQFVCDRCKTQFSRPPSARGKPGLKGIYCSQICAARSTNLRGEDHPRWRGGRYITSHGYVYVLHAEHPRANRQGYVYEHILVAEKSLGRPIASEQDVHHINGIPNDNRPENLIVMIHGRHRAHHNTGKKASPALRRKLSRAARLREERKKLASTPP